MATGETNVKHTELGDLKEAGMRLLER